MQRFNPPRVRCRVHSRKQGVLSRMGHDLCFELDYVEIALDGQGGGEARTDPRALHLLGAERDGQVDRKLLSTSDQRRVLANLRQDVLDVRRHPQIRFTWQGVEVRGGTVTLRGELLLHGVTKPLVLRGERRSGRLELSAQLDQRDFQIKPFSAAFGALKVQAEVRLEVSVEEALLGELP